MKSYQPAQLRNVGLFSHGGAGKTSLAEALLYKTGAITRLGNVEDGTTTTDFDPDEVKRHMSVSLALAPVEWRDCKINIIDAPGYADFFGEVAEAMRVSDGALVLVDAAAGVQVGTDLVWKKADAESFPRMVFVNRMERENANFYRTLDQLKAKYGKGVVALTVPVGEEHSFLGVVDLVSGKVYTDGKETAVPADVQANVDKHREALIETACEVDDDLITKYLEGEELTADEIKGAIRRGVLQGRIVPVLCGSATGLKGIEPLLDALVDYMPSAADVKVRLADGQVLTPTADGRAAVLVFKTVSDPYIGKLSYLRVYTGRIQTDSHVWNGNRNHEERIGQLFVLRGKHQEPVQVLSCGDIGAVPKLQETYTGETLTTRDSPIVLAGIEFPEPAYSASVTPKTKQDVDKLSTALARIVEEDPSLKVHREDSTGETIISGLGESHVQIAAERMQRKFGVNVTLDVPRVPYRETIKGRARAEGRHVKQTGGHGQYGVCWLEIEPLPRGAGYEFVDKIVGGVISQTYRPAVDKGVREAMQEGILAGFPVVDVRATLYDGKEHPVDSSEMAFKLAGALAFKKAFMEANPVLLEPIMSLEVTVPDEFTGDVMGDLNSKRARVLGMVPGDGVTTIQAEAPYAELLRYATDLRSITQGRGLYRMSFTRYEEVPAHLAQQIVERRKKEREQG